jgi:hypothetical protein
MYTAPYSVIKHGTLDDLVRINRRYQAIICHFKGSGAGQGNVRTCEQYSALVEPEIVRRYNEGERTIEDTLRRIMGPDVVIMERR